MKQRWIFRVVGITLALFFASCTGFFEIEGREEITDFGGQPGQPTESTSIYFDNSNRMYAVDVFSDSFRTNKIISLSGYQNTFSNPLSWNPSYEGRDFYFTYYLPLYELSNLLGEGLKYFPFIPRKFGGDNSIVVIPRNEKTRVLIPDIYNDIGFSEPLFNETYLAITNNYASAIYLGIGNNPQYPMNLPANQYLINNGVTAFYELDPTANISGYYISRAGNRLPLPEDFTVIGGFVKGYLYHIVVTGNSVTLPYYRLLTLGSL